MKQCISMKSIKSLYLLSGKSSPWSMCFSLKNVIIFWVLWSSGSIRRKPVIFVPPYWYGSKSSVWKSRQVMMRWCWSDINPTCCACFNTSGSISIEQSMIMFFASDNLTWRNTCRKLLDANLRSICLTVIVNPLASKTFRSSVKCGNHGPRNGLVLNMLGWRIKRNQNLPDSYKIVNPSHSNTFTRSIRALRIVSGSGWMFNERISDWESGRTSMWGISLASSMLWAWIADEADPGPKTAATPCLKI